MNDFLQSESLQNTSKPFIWWDLETQNTNLMHDNLPWQIGWIVVKDNIITEKHSHFIKWPNFTISIGAAKVTKFNRQEYDEKAEDPQKILDLFEQYVYSNQYICGCHNGMGFDCYILMQWRRKLGKDIDYSFIPRTIDTDALARSIKLGISFNRKTDDLTAFLYKMLSCVRKGMRTNLTSLGKEYGIEYNYDTLHCAENDVILDKLVWDKLKYKIDI